MDRTFLKSFGKSKKLLAVLLIAALGILLIILSSSYGGREASNEEVEKIGLEEYKENMENEIAALCSSVSGVGRCRVFITFERGEETVYKGSSVVEIRPPKVKGVMIACRGAESDGVRSQLTDMMTALFDIGSNRVAILKLNS